MLEKKQKSYEKQKIFFFSGRKVVCLPFWKGFAQIFAVPSWNHAKPLYEGGYSLWLYKLNLAWTKN